MNLRPAALLLTAALLAAATLGGCGYRLAAAPALGEPIRVVVVGNDARLVRAQAVLQRAVADALQSRLGWQVSPTGSAKLELTIAQERIDGTGTDRRDVPARWSIRLQGHALIAARAGTAYGDYQGTGYASGTGDEPEAIGAAADDAAAQISVWLEHAVPGWQKPAPAP
jgi:hypothetical protein